MTKHEINYHLQNARFLLWRIVIRKDPCITPADAKIKHAEIELELKTLAAELRHLPSTPRPPQPTLFPIIKKRGKP